jgi:ATP-dependent Lon protease
MITLTNFFPISNHGKDISNIITNTDNASNPTTSDQTQPLSSASNVNESFSDKMKSIQDGFQPKLAVIENENKSALLDLQQEQTRKDQKSKHLQEKLKRLDQELNDNADNDLNYDSPDNDEDNDDNNDFYYDSDDMKEVNHN